MNERIFPTFPGNNIECNFTHLANNSTFSNKTTPSFKGNPNFTELKQVIPPLTLFFFVQKCTKYQMVCHPCEEKYETSLFKWWFQQRQKCEQNFSFGLNVGVFLKTTKGTFLIIKEKKIHRKKNFFVIFAPLLLQVSCTQVPKNTTLPFEIIFSSDFFRINAAKFWKCYRFQCFGFFWKYFFAIVEKRKWQWKKKMRNKSTFYNGGVFVRMWWWCYMML